MTTLSLTLTLTLDLDLDPNRDPDPNPNPNPNPEQVCRTLPAALAAPLTLLLCAATGAVSYQLVAYT